MIEQPPKPDVPRPQDVINRPPAGETPLPPDDGDIHEHPDVHPVPPPTDPGPSII